LPHLAQPQLQKDPAHPVVSSAHVQRRNFRHKSGIPNISERDILRGIVWIRALLDPVMPVWALR